MIHPTIHLNGTGIESLREQYLACYEAIANAIRIMDSNGPNARDYYVQGPAAYPMAVVEHATRIQVLVKLHGELERLIVGLDDFPQGGQSEEKGG
jgi:hypothetical protein